jgi:DNA-binding transcriptional regulator PaaX
LKSCGVAPVSCVRSERQRPSSSGSEAPVAALAAGFVTSAAVLRHLQADPLLPPALLPRGWPGEALRADYDRYDVAFKQVWRAWYKAQMA